MKVYVNDNGRHILELTYRHMSKEQQCDFRELSQSESDDYISKLDFSILDITTEQLRHSSS